MPNLCNDIPLGTPVRLVLSSGEQFKCKCLGKRNGSLQVELLEDAASRHVNTAQIVYWEQLDQGGAPPRIV